jgi:hypothetical protein
MFSANFTLTCLQPTLNSLGLAMNMRGTLEALLPRSDGEKLINNNGILRRALQKAFFYPVQCTFSMTTLSRILNIANSSALAACFLDDADKTILLICDFFLENAAPATIRAYFAVSVATRNGLAARVYNLRYWDLYDMSPPEQRVFPDFEDVTELLIEHTVKADQEDFGIAARNFYESEKTNFAIGIESVLFPEEEPADDDDPTLQACIDKLQPFCALYQKFCGKSDVRTQTWGNLRLAAIIVYSAAPRVDVDELFVPKVGKNGLREVSRRAESLAPLKLVYADATFAKLILAKNAAKVLNDYGIQIDQTLIDSAADASDAFTVLEAVILMREGHFESFNNICKRSAMAWSALRILNTKMWIIWGSCIQPELARSLVLRVLPTFVFDLPRRGAAAAAAAIQFVPPPRLGNAEPEPEAKKPEPKVDQAGGQREHVPVKPSIWEGLSF